MKKTTHNILLMTVITLIVSCQRKPVDRTNFRSVADNIIELIADNDTAGLKKLYEPRKDGSIEKAIARLSENDLKQFEGKNLIYLEKDTFLITASQQYFFLTIFFKEDKSDTAYFVAQAQYHKDALGRIMLENLGFRNLSKECLEESQKEYVPSGLSVKSLHWKTNYAETAFAMGAVDITNESGADVDYLKLRLNIMVNGVSKFNRTIELTHKIYNGDLMVRVEVPELTNYYGGGDVLSRESVSFTHTILEALPKGEPWACSQYKRLHTIKINK
jgi:hypothetical protein